MQYNNAHVYGILLREKAENRTESYNMEHSKRSRTKTGRAPQSVEHGQHHGPYPVKMVISIKKKKNEVKN
jgi:hypothetical protein